MVYILLIMILIFAVIFILQYKLAKDSGKFDIKSILETTVLWSVISYIILGIIILGIVFLTTSSD